MKERQHRVVVTAEPGGMAAAPKARRLRGPALLLLLLAAVLGGYGAWVLARPLYWRFYADVIHRYESDAAAQLIQELQKETAPLGDGSVTAELVQPALKGAGRKAAPGGAQAAAADLVTGGARGGSDPVPQQDGASAAAAAAAGAAPAVAVVAPVAMTPAGGTARQDTPAAGGTGPAAGGIPPKEQQAAAAPRAASPGAAPAEEASGPGGGERAVAPSAAAAKLAPDELERARAMAREKQWEDEWWGQWQKAEVARKARESKEKRDREARLVKQFNHTLTREFVQSLAQDGYLVITWANHHYTDFALSWVYHVQQVGITGYMVGAMDDAILTALAKRKIHTFSMAAGLTTGDFGWGSKSFAKMGRKKINLVARFLELGVKVVISDVDVMWLRNPLPFFERFPGADVLTSTDHLAPTVGAEEALEVYPAAGSAFNIGIMAFGERSLPFVRHWIQIIEADDTIWDQNAFNDLIRAGQVVQEDDPHHYFLGANGSLTVGVLPIAFFCSGHVYFTQRMHRALGVEPYAVHATFQFSGTPGKRHRFREAQLWLEDGSYYHPPAGFLTYVPHIPKDLLDRAGPRTHRMDLDNAAGHFELVNHQLRELRHALMLATILGRAVILPELWCGLDRYWAPHAGTIPGSNFSLPFVCPADHILDLENGWARAMDAGEFGPGIAYREAGFLLNPALPGSVRGSVVHVLPCKRGAVGCASGENPATLEFDRLFVQEGLDSERVARALASAASISVLNFTDVGAAVANFTRPADYARFAKRVSHYGGVFCCADAHPGHVHYDLLWDVPHTDRFGRAWGGDAPWRPVAGP